VTEDIKEDNLWLMKGDCLERMKEIPDGSVDMILADPPYGTTACKWDSIIPLESMWEQLKRTIKPNGAIVMTASQPFTTTLIASNMREYKYNWVWNKKAFANQMMAKKQPLRITEDIVVFNSKVYNPQGLIEVNKTTKQGSKVTDNVGGGVRSKSYTQTHTNYPRNILEFSKDRPSVHPTQKPVALMEYLIKTYTNESETVLDFTMGSGTTGVACKNLDRKFIGIEMDDKYFNVAKERILGESNE
jgi:site-specific DNA-methyltransferase (adenine-specific)